MHSDDFLIDDASGHLSKSKNREYLGRVKLRFRTFIDFLQEEGLTVREILAGDEPVTDTTRIRKSDLTEDGFEVVLKSYDKWLRGHDRGKAISDVRIMEKALSAVRDAK